MTKRQKSQLRWGYFFIAPTIIGLICFNFGPMLFSIGLSFTKWNVISDKEFIGFQNFVNLFKDRLFYQSLKVTFYYAALYVPLATCIPFLIAVLLNTKVKGLSVFRTIFYLPSIVPAVASAAVWLHLFNPMYGLLNTIIKAVGLPAQGFIYTEEGAVPSMVIMAVWGAGNTVIIYLAGLQGVSKELYEAADIDGANAVQKFFRITVPLMTPIVFYNFVMAIIGSMQTFTSSFIMTDGGPAHATYFYALMVYQTAFNNMAMGYAAAMSWILFIIIGILTAIVFKTQNRWVIYENGEG